MLVHFLVAIIYCVLYCHVHLYLGVWLVSLNNKVLESEVINLFHLPRQLECGEGTRGTLQLGRKRKMLDVHKWAKKGLSYYTFFNMYCCKRLDLVQQTCSLRGSMWLR